MATAVFVLAAWTTAGGVQPSLDARALDEAIAIGQSRVALHRTRFHQPYRIPVAQPPVDYVDVVTPFRRVVLLAEAQAFAGSGPLTHRRALEAIGDRAASVELRIELTFQPHHTLVGMPDYEVTLIASGGAILRPRVIDAVPRYGPRIDAQLAAAPPALGEALPFTGGTVSAGFDAAALSGGPYEIVLEERGASVARTTIDFGRVR